jgi:hypothetical protein
MDSWWQNVHYFTNALFAWQILVKNRADVLPENELQTKHGVA